MEDGYGIGLVLWDPRWGPLVDTVLTWSLCQGLAEHYPATKPRTLGFLAQMWRWLQPSFMLHGRFSP